MKPADAGPDDPVCPGAKPGQPDVGMNRVRSRICEAAGLVGQPGLDLHSLRHSERFYQFRGPSQRRGVLEARAGYHVISQNTVDELLGWHERGSEPD